MDSRLHTHTNMSTQSLTHSHSHSSLTLTGVPLVPLGLRRFCMAGVAQRALARGRMYALASLWRPSGVPLASLWRPSGAPWSPPLLRRRRGPTCIGKGSHVRPGVPLASLWCPVVSAAFAWQAWTNVHWQGVGCTPWRPSGVPLVPFGLRGFCVAGVAHRALARGRMYALASLWRPSGVPLVPLGLCRFCVAGVAQRASPRGRMYALASLGLRRSVGAFCVAGVGQSAVPGGQGS